MEKKRLIANVVKPWDVKAGKLVAPVVLIRQGVLCGSAGCVLWKGDVIKASVKQWEGIPVVLNHPKIDGQFVSAKQKPGHIIGRVTKPRFDSFKNCLHATIEVSIGRPNTNNIMDLKEVSVGVFGESKTETGLYHNKYYEAVATSMIPDHLALLKGDIGACSWEDGCGIRVNQKCDNYMRNFMDEMFTSIAFNAIYNSQKHKLNNSKTMEEEVLMPMLLQSEEQEKEIDVNSWEESEILPPLDVALSIHKAKNNAAKEANNKNENSIGDEDEAPLMPNSY